MKKIKFSILVIVFVFVLSGCSGKMSGLPKFDRKECYYGEGVQDFTDYCKYYYNKESIKNFATNPKFKKVETNNISEIKGYFENFEVLVKYEDYYKNYDFSYMTQVKEGDYFYIHKNKDYEAFGEYGYYDVYYVDMTNNILYFIHSNI